MKKIILASGSPRRKELLEMLNIPFEVKVSDVDETTDIISPAEKVKYLSLIKARAVADICENNSIIIGSDTVVSRMGKIFGKPKNAADAKEMLKQLSGKKHSVFTGLTVIVKDEKGGLTETSLADCTEVDMLEMTDEEIDNYISSGEPMDKAGAYAIQGKGSAFIEAINGDYYTVMGLPVRLLYKTLKENGVDVASYWK